MLEGVGAVNWKKLTHAYGSAVDVPDLLQQLLVPDAKVRSTTLHTLYGNVYHQGTRYPATPFVIPFLIELISSPQVFQRVDLLRFWGDLITGFFSVQERPTWSDGKRIFVDGTDQGKLEKDKYSKALGRIYEESIKGYSILCRLLQDEDEGVRTGVAWVLACLPSKASESAPLLITALANESSGWVRASMAFSCGELGAIAELQRLLKEDTFAAVRCMAACQLARIQPEESLLNVLLPFVIEPIEGYENVFGAGGKSTGDAAYAISRLPRRLQQLAIPAICDRLEQARSFDTIPLVCTLFSAAFNERVKTDQPLTTLQQYVLQRMVNTYELWNIGNLGYKFESHCIPQDRYQCAKMIGQTIANEDVAFSSLRSGVAFAEIGFLEQARNYFEQALQREPTILERSPSPDECLLFYAKAIAEVDAERAIAAYQRAVGINPVVKLKVNPTWHLADVLQQRKLLD